MDVAVEIMVNDSVDSCMTPTQEKQRERQLKHKIVTTQQQHYPNKLESSEDNDIAHHLDYDSLDKLESLSANLVKTNTTDDDDDDSDDSEMEQRRLDEKLERLQQDMLEDDRLDTDELEETLVSLSQRGISKRRQAIAAAFAEKCLQEDKNFTNTTKKEEEEEDSAKGNNVNDVSVGLMATGLLWVQRQNSHGFPCLPSSPTTPKDKSIPTTTNIPITSPSTPPRKTPRTTTKTSSYLPKSILMNTLSWTNLMSSSPSTLSYREAGEEVLDAREDNPHQAALSPQPQERTIIDPVGSMASPNRQERLAPVTTSASNTPASPYSFHTPLGSVGDSDEFDDDDDFWDAPELKPIHYVPEPDSPHRLTTEPTTVTSLSQAVVCVPWGSTTSTDEEQAAESPKKNHWEALLSYSFSEDRTDLPPPEEKSLLDEQDIDWIPPVRVVPEVSQECPYILQPHQMHQIAQSVLPTQIACCQWKRLYSLARDGDSFENCIHYFIGQETRTLLVIRTTKGEIFGGYADEKWEGVDNHYHGSSLSCLYAFRPDEDDAQLQDYMTHQEIEFDTESKVHGREGSHNDTTTLNNMMILPTTNKDDSLDSCLTSQGQEQLLEAPSSPQELMESDDKNTKDTKLHVYKWSGENRYIQIVDMARKRLAFGGGGQEGSFGLCIEKDFQCGSTGQCETFHNEPLCSQENFKVVDMEIYSFLTGQF